MMSYKNKFIILALIPLYFLIIAFFIQPWDQIFHGLSQIIICPDYLITDYFVIGGPSAALFNASILTLLSLFIIYKLKIEFDGHTITSTCLLFGFSLFGKNILNIWFILIGVWLYAYFHKTSIKKYLYIGLYGTSLSPIITMILQIDFLALPFKIFLSIVIGLIIGFILPPLSTHTFYSHKGYSLYNVGFASGIIATIIVSLFKSFGITVHTHLIWSTNYDKTFFLILLILFSSWILISLIISKYKVLKEYRLLICNSGIAHSDFLKDHGFACVFFNMGINGLFATLFLFFINGNFNGPTIGGIFTIVGFSTTGKHLRNIFPIMIGVYLGSLTKNWQITDPSCLLALLFSTTLAPIAGEFGILSGILAGYLHSSLALNIGLINSGLNLYNNGFAGGLIAMVLVPVIQSIQDKKARANSDISL